MFKLRVLGGVGEKGRVGFEVLIDGKKMVLDYGVKRKIMGGVDEVYPLKASGELDFLFLSHSHLDHVGAVPLLDFSYIVCSKPTFELLKPQIKTWMKISGKSLLNSERYESFLDRPLVFKERSDDMRVILGKSGHTVGSQWIFLKECSFLYTGDIAIDSSLYTFDALPRANFLLVDTAYGIRKLKRREELLNLVDVKDKRIVLPLPRMGRSQEILMELLKNRITPVFVDEKIIQGFEFLRKYEDWLKVKIDLPDLNTNLPDNLPYGIYLATDGMMTSGSSVELYRKLKDDGDTLFIITGYVEEGTLGWKLLRQDDRAISFTWKIHPDVEDLSKIIKMVEPEFVLPFHSDWEDLEELRGFSERNGFNILIPKRGEFINMEGIS